VEVERYDRSTQTDFAVEASCQADQSDTDAPATAVMTPKKRAVHRPLMTTKTTSPALGTAAATTAATMTDVGNTAAAAASPGGVAGQSQSNTSQQHDTSTTPLAPEEKSVIESSDDFEASIHSIQGGHGLFTVHTLCLSFQYSLDPNSGFVVLLQTQRQPNYHRGMCAQTNK
jgi:hypothetical protein